MERAAIVVVVVVVTMMVRGGVVVVEEFKRTEDRGDSAVRLDGGDEMRHSC